MGEATAHWSKQAPAAAQAIKPKSIRDAMAAAYPAFREPLLRVVPNDVLAGQPKGRHGWGGGQYLTFRESEAVSAAAFCVLGRGWAAVPVHDALIVPNTSRPMCWLTRRHGFPVWLKYDSLRAGEIRMEALMGAAVEVTRLALLAAGLRREASRCDDGRVACRLLAIAHVLDGSSRTTSG